MLFARIGNVEIAAKVKDNPFRKNKLTKVEKTDLLIQRPFVTSTLENGNLTIALGIHSQCRSQGLAQ